MISWFWYKTVIIDTIWEFPPDNVAELMLMIFATIFLGIMGLILIPLDIILSSLYLLYWLLSKIELKW